MIGHFPVPGTDELFYSLCARYSDHMEYTTVAAAIYSLFGSKAAVATIDLPSRLGLLVTNLPPGYRVSVDDFIDRHTLLPFYAPFLPPKTVEQLHHNMWGNARGIHARAGIIPVPLPERLRFCPVCADQDRSNIGEYYWHRVHQLPGVHVCPAHEVWLEQSSVGTRNRKHSGEFVSAERAIVPCSPRLLDRSRSCDQILLAIARDADWLLGQRGLTGGPAELHKRYIVALIDKELASYHGSVRRPLLMKEFTTYYPPGLLEMIQCDTIDGRKIPWPCRLVGSTRSSQHPLYHLLVIHFLEYTTAEFFALPTEYLPFGSGPWPCLNPVCDYYQRPVIPECTWKIGYTHHPKGRPLGRFVCPKCGFIYNRTGPDRKPEDRFRHNHHPEAYGPVWESRLVQLWEDPQVSIDQVADVLGVEIYTVRQQSARLGLAPFSLQELPPSDSATECRSSSALSSSVTKLEAYRSAWLIALKENPGVGMGALERMFRRICSWLRRCDAEWFYQHRPHPQERSPRPPRIDWASRDCQLAEEVQVVATQIRTAPGFPTRVTKTAIGKRTGRMAWIIGKPEKIPLAIKAIADVVEGVEEFALRRVEWAVGQFRREGSFPSRRQFLARARIYSTTDLHVLEEVIETALRTLALTSINNCMRQ